MDQFFINKKKWIIISVVLIFVVLLFVKFLINEMNKSPTDEMEQPFILPSELQQQDIELETDEQMFVYIDLKGAVEKPGVYQLEKDSRVQDVIQMAGGFLETADQTHINLAARVEDEMVIYVPEIGESMETPFVQEAKDGRININKANADELQTLSGIGATKATSIISYRETNGPFQRVEDLMQVSGIGEKTFEQLKDQITVR